MGDLSPVIEAYLSGFKQQQGILEQANTLVQQKQQNEERKKANQLREKELNDIASRFDTSSQQEQARIDLQRQIHDLSKQLHLGEAKDKILAQFSSGQRHLSGETIQDPTAQNMSKPLFQSNPQQVIDIPGFGPQTFNSNEINTPERATQRKIKEAEQLLPIKTKEATILERVKQTGRENLLQNRLDSQETINDLKLENSRVLRDMVSANARDIAEIRGAAKVQDMLHGLGVNSPEELKHTIALHALDRSVGKEDKNSLKGTAMHNMVENYMKEQELTDFPGESKGRQKLFDITTKTQDLLQKFDELSQKYPAPTNLASKLGNKVAAMTTYTQMGKDFANFKTNVIDLMQSKGVNNTKLIDTSKEQSFLGELLPNETSSAQDWANKRMKLVRNTFTAIQGQINGLSKIQRQALWKDIINETPYIKQDHRLEKELTNAIETGNWNASK